jgi:hypothetical protein
VIPALLIVSTIAPFAGLGVMVNALALGLNTMLFTSTDAVIETSVLLEILKVAMSAGPLGTVAGVQLAGLLQLLSTGLAFQVALSAKTALSAPSESVRMMAQERIKDFMAPIMPTMLFESKAAS